LARRGIKVQRRVALAQFLFWPTLIGTGIAVGAAVAFRRHRRAVVALPPQPATEPSMNG
jgi:hypothetical protein